MTADQNSILDQIISTQGFTHRENFKPQAILNQILLELTEREREVVSRRFGLRGGEGETLESIGGSLQVTRERVRQIERLAVSKLKESKIVYNIIQPIRQVVVEVIEGEGGAVTEDKLLKSLGELAAGVPASILKFFLNELLGDVVAGFGGEASPFVKGWRLCSSSLEALQQLHELAQEIITTRGVLVPENELVQALLEKKPTSPLGVPINDGILLAGLLELSQSVCQNAFGEWGLTHWETVTPKRMNDKIYLVLKKHGQPLHFREIARFINEAKFDRKLAYPPTVHNELIMDQKYVLVGRGIYALREWGFEPGVVADVLVDIIKQKGQPMTREELVQAVMKQRVVKPATIHLALTNKQKFEHLPDGRYGLAGPVV